MGKIKICKKGRRNVNLTEMLEKSGALMKGHFLLSSGLHSDAYIQCAKLLQNTSYAQKIGKSLADMLKQFEPDCVVSPALGGMIVGYEVARNLKVDFIFAERDENGRMTFRRGFDPTNYKRIVIVEDVVTTGKSTKEVLELLRESSISVLATSSIVSRQERAEIENIPFVSLETIPLKVYEPKDCPLCKSGLPLVKPGSRRNPIR